MWLVQNSNLISMDKEDWAAYFYSNISDSKPARDPIHCVTSYQVSSYTGEPHATALPGLEIHSNGIHKLLPSNL